MEAKGILAGRSPLSQCAGVLYFAAALMGQPKPANEISRTLGISADGTIRTVYKVLFNEKDKLIEPEWLKGGRADVAKLPSA